MGTSVLEKELATYEAARPSLLPQALVNSSLFGANKW